MKRILAFILALAMVVALSVTAFAVDMPDYDGNWDEGPGANAGEINPPKHDKIQTGVAGDMSKGDDNMFLVPGVKGDAVPTIDGVYTDGEGYADIEGWEDYTYIVANSHTYDAAAFQAWYDEIREMDLVMKYCWDGQYIYLYFEYAVKGYMNPSKTALDLWKWNCIQFGIAATDAVEPGERGETLFGMTSAGTPLAGTAAGPFIPTVKTGDYMGTLADTAVAGQKKVTHEFRIDICKSLGQETPMKSGDMIKASIVVMCNNGGLSSGQRALCFGHGITGQESNKYPQHFINYTLGEGYDPAKGGIEIYYEATEKEISVDYRANTSFFFHQIKDSDDFVAENGTHTPATGDEKFAPATFSTEAEMARFVSAIYPAGLWAAGDIGCTHAVIRYRTNTEGMKIGLNFINNGMKADEEKGETEAQFIPEATAYPIEETPIVADGEWHDAIIKLSDCLAYAGLIVKTGIEISAGSVDIESIKFFGWDPAEIYGIGVVEPGCECDDCANNPDCPCGGECDEDLCFCSCFDEEHTHNYVDGKCECGAKDPNYVPPTTPPTGGGTGEGTGEGDKEKEKDGCKSSIAAGAALVVVASIASGAVLLKKKED